MNVLIRILRYPTTDDGEVFLTFCSWIVGIDESSSTRNKLGESDVLNFSLHQINPVLLVLFSYRCHGSGWPARDAISSYSFLRHIVEEVIAHLQQNMRNIDEDPVFDQ